MYLDILVCVVTRCATHGRTLGQCLKKQHPCVVGFRNSYFYVPLGEIVVWLLNDLV